MASGWTNKGRWNALNIVLRNGTEPTNFYIALVTSAAVPDADTNTLSQLTEIATGNGYTSGGIQITRGDGSSGIGFDVATEDDANDRAHFELEDVVWTASGGPIPASGSGASYAVLTDDNGTVGSREVWYFFDLGGARTVSDGQTLTLQNAAIRIA